MASYKLRIVASGNRRLGVRIPSGAQDQQGPGLPERRSGPLLVSPLVDGWVLGGCSCDEHLLRPGESGRVPISPDAFGSDSGRCPSHPKCRDAVPGAVRREGWPVWRWSVTVTSLCINPVIGARLARWRNARGLTQLALARRVPVARSTIAGAESGRQCPDERWS
ncbi:helix-turn-helix transcriptional regulator [Salinispora arenicola]|uniref:helix-turn-helix transcriptional regulator n=1 Tax=Salinispora arenicola TaxID=168697 RepID=UPI001E3A78C0|nr:helix-turn-helix transcriptional regulator [Salinispora arenicola]